MSYITRFEELVRQLDELVSEIETEANDTDVDLTIDFDEYLLDPLNTIQEEGKSTLKTLIDEIEEAKRLAGEAEDDPNQGDFWQKRFDNPAYLDKGDLL